jgi:hypothetical protein
MAKRVSGPDVWTCVSVAVLSLFLLECSRRPDDRVLDSWSAESIAMTVNACKEGVPESVSRDVATRACECIVAESQRRWPTPRRYSENTEKHNNELMAAGVLAECRAKALGGGQGPATPRTPSRE